MTNRIRHLTVVLEHDEREEEEGINQITQAITMVKGVAAVYPGDPIDPLAKVVARHELSQRIRDAIESVLSP